MARRLALAGLAALCAVPAQPAAAVRVAAGVAGGITVYPSMAACGTLRFGRAVTGAGVFTSAGAVSGPGTTVGVVRGFLPVVLAGTSSWSGCLPDAYAGATRGYATYTLTASTAQGDFAESLHCVVENGGLRCA